MHVLNVNHTLDPVNGGGTAERTIKMSRFLARAGIACTVLTGRPGFDAAATPDEPNLRIVTVPLLSRRFFIPRISTRELDALVSEADIVHLMGHWTLLNALVYRAARRLGKPYVVCPAGALPVFGRSKILKRLYNLAVGTNIVRNATAKIAITNAERTHFNAYGIASKDVVVIPNGVDVEEYSEIDTAGFRSKHGLQQQPFILFMGRLNPIKGPDLLLAAFTRLKDEFPHWHLVFAGPDSGMLAALKQLTHETGLDQRVHFIGYVSGREKAAAFAAAALLAIPSRQEAMSIVVLEAGILRTPVLVTDQCGMNVVAGFGGEVVPATSEGLQRGLQKMLRNPDELRQRGARLAEFVNSNYRWTSVVRAFIELYDRLVPKQTA